MGGVGEKHNIRNKFPSVVEEKYTKHLINPDGCCRRDMQNTQEILMGGVGEIHKIHKKFLWVV